MGYQALLFCTDEKLARVISQVFGELEFAVDPVSEPFAAVKKLMAQHYDAVVVDCENDQNSSLLLKSARNSSFNQGSLAIALVEGQSGVAKAYRIGANLVLTKPINVEQTRGTLRVARGLLRKGSDSATGASQVSSQLSSQASGSPAKASPAADSLQTGIREAQAGSAPAPTFSEIEAPRPAMAAPARATEKPATVPAPLPPSKAPVFVPGPAGTTLFAAEQAKNAVGRAEPAKPAAVPAPVPRSTSSSQGAASAPARAKEAVRPAKEAGKEKTVEKDVLAEVTPLEANFSNPTMDAPSFLGSVQDEGGGRPGISKALIGVAVLVLAAAGYFGWTKFGQGHPAAATQATVPAPQPRVEPVPEPPYFPTPTPDPAAASKRPTATTPAATSPKTSSSQPAQAAADETRISVLMGPDTKTAAPPPLMVKSASTAGKARTADESPTQLPSPLAVAPSNDSGLSQVLTAESSSVAKPALARMKISQGVSQGLVIKRVQPKYPPSALASRAQGAVLIEATISKDGIVVNPRVLSGDARLSGAALEAVRQWRYKPYYLDGVPVEIQTQITINFKAN